MFKAKQNAYMIIDRNFETTETDNLLFELNKYSTRISLLSVRKTDGFYAIKRKPERMKEREKRS